MNKSATRALLGLSLLVTALLAWFAPDEAELVSPSKNQRNVSMAPIGTPKATARSANASLDLPIDRDELSNKTSSKLFGIHSWTKVVVPPKKLPAPVVVPVAPPPPSAPAMPYVYLGRYTEGDTKLIILSRGNRVITAKEGDILDKQYLIERIDASTAQLKYLPLGIPQTLATGGSQ